MEMMPEYHHGLIEEAYFLALSSDDVGENPLKVKRVLAKYFSKFEEYSEELFLQLCNRPSSRVFSNPFFSQQVPIAHELHSALEKVGASPRLYNTSNYKIYPEATQKGCASFWQLKRMGEYALDLWAEENNISTAFRCYHRLTWRGTTPPDRLIRVWLENDSPKLIAKTESNADTNPRLLIPGGQSQFSLHQNEVNIHKWNTLQDFLDEEFWTAETWYSEPLSRKMRDGRFPINRDDPEYQIEAYHQGRYKLLYSLGEDIDLAQQAYTLFEDMVDKG
jgi:hypothetical protein